ncbi:replicative helicase loader/inhibitor [Paenibacillus camelliae]|uniref:replicative helicase loader/inhibitor n=1 Tax=Paenibacillus camelliae TaxID=512410 RepID=UPI003D8172C9|nr:replicative helicase loader/inhibitor [Paenibacillus camelliae]
MNRQEVTLILAKASAAYPNQAPNFVENPSIFELWCEMLSDVDAQLGISNLNQHIMTSSFFPTISDIAKQPERNFYDHHKHLAHQETVLLEQSLKKAIPMPEYIKRRWLSNE